MHATFIKMNSLAAWRNATGLYTSSPPPIAQTHSARHRGVGFPFLSLAGVRPLL